MLTAWRITKRRHSKTAFDGSGARRYGGRWNSPGVAVVYTAETQSLAVLEMLVHLDATALLQRYVLIGVKIDKSLIRELDRSELPRNWSDSTCGGLKNIGNDWVRSAGSVALRVPSTLVPSETNLLLNPRHSDFHRVVIGKPIPFWFDPRLSI
jgi:Uncharacterized conserved protein